MVSTEQVGQSRRIEELRAVETSPGVVIYRPTSIVNQLVTEGTKSPSQESPITTSADRGREVSADCDAVGSGRNGR